MRLNRHPGLINTGIRAEILGRSSLRNAKEHILHIALLFFKSTYAMQLPRLGRLLVGLHFRLNSMTRYIDQVKIA